MTESCPSSCTKKDRKQNSVRNSQSQTQPTHDLPRYDTHNLKESVHPYDNPAYQSEFKNYSTSSTLPKDDARKLWAPKKTITALHIQGKANHFAVFSLSLLQGKIVDRK